MDPKRVWHPLGPARESGTGVPDAVRRELRDRDGGCLDNASWSPADGIYDELSRIRHRCRCARKLPALHASMRSTSTRPVHSMILFTMLDGLRISMEPKRAAAWSNTPMPDPSLNSAAARP